MITLFVQHDSSSHFTSRSYKERVPRIQGRKVNPSICTQFINVLTYLFLYENFFLLKSLSLTEVEPQSLVNCLFLLYEVTSLLTNRPQLICFSSSFSQDLSLLTYTFKVIPFDGLRVSPTSRLHSSPSHTLCISTSGPGLVRIPSVLNTPKTGNRVRVIFHQLQNFPTSYPFTSHRTSLNVRYSDKTDCIISYLTALSLTHF